jgi:ferric-dicitrate binding protein FerR (iron transport regulator)
MNRHSRCCRPLLFCLIAAILVVPATMGMTHLELLSQQGPSGDLSVVGEVTVNGTNAISGATVFSDSTVTTAKGSSAVVSLGKLGRVEVLPESTMKLSFTDSSIKVSMLDAGRVRVSSSSSVAATATTRDGEVNAKGSRLNEFTVDTSCGDTFVSVKKGSVALRAGDTVKQIAAGSQDTAGTARPGCTRTGRR